MIAWFTVDCPYCGEPFETSADGSAGARQIYTEDCQICCRPILFTVDIDADGGLSAVETRAEND